MHLHGHVFQVVEHQRPRG
ncbi:MAG: hypothetical protein V9G14_10605 [Cypionkella sp.]